MTIIFGGTFDPVHLGHMAVADQAVNTLRPDAFWFLVANTTGARKRVYAPAMVRLEMVRAAVDGDARFTVVDLEIRRGGVTYTAETMAELHRLQPETVFELMLGADSARSIRSWRHGEELLRSERFVIVNRSGEPPLTLAEASSLGYDGERTRLLEVTSPPVSASDVRRRVAHGQPVDGLVPPAAAEIMRREGLYSARSGRA